MSHCPSCGAYPGNDHHEACTMRVRGLRKRDRSESIQRLIDENQRLREALRDITAMHGEKNMRTRAREALSCG